MAKNNPIVEIYKGVEIKKSNYVLLRFTSTMYKYLVLESERTSLPITQILTVSSKPCEACSKIDVIAYNKDDEEVSIKRGILSRHNLQCSGRPIIQQANEKINKK